MDNPRQPHSNTPDYKKIYSDLVDLKYPEKKHECAKILSKKNLSAFDVIEINRIIFSYNQNIKSNQSHRSYNKETIFKILEYQKKNYLNNTQLALHFKLSRNTVAKWKTLFSI
ncbi:helix-turn-helix domain-containing protein [Chryseobacterium sp. ES2]|uniref:Helix-turn-helix domain-containing protein n=1 Tax=Chryseobacterium metallicongregator TaxID=3073042 RepID=A0ABU1DZD8_9FLAO|nr:MULTISPECIES: transposase [Chryseobacterium]MDR4950909.1 helix-turn-helix domain-containing protein [Chryseobacterium sp. ES2]